MEWFRVAYDFVGVQRNYIGTDEYDEQVFEEEPLQATDYYYVQAESEEEARAAARDAIEESGAKDVDIWDVQGMGTDDLDALED